MRTVVGILAGAFIALLAVLTAAEFGRYGVTPLGVVAAAIIAVLALGVIGSLTRQPPRG